MYVVHIVVVGSRISRQKRTTEERVVERERERAIELEGVRGGLARERERDQSRSRS